MKIGRITARSGELQQIGPDFHDDSGDFHDDWRDFHDDRGDLHENSSNFHDDREDLHDDRGDFHDDWNDFHENPADHGAFKPNALNPRYRVFYPPPARISPFFPTFATCKTRITYPKASSRGCSGGK
jgi:hypothetical protein